MTRQPAARRRQTDARWLIDAVLLLIAVSNYWMSRMNLNISPDQVIWPRAGLVFFRLLSTRAIPAGEVWINDNGTSAAIWFPPGMQAWPVELVAKLKLPPLFLTLCGFGRMRRGGALSDAMERAHPQEPHFYLYFLAVGQLFREWVWDRGSLMLRSNASMRWACPLTWKTPIREIHDHMSARGFWRARTLPLKARRL